MNEFNIRSPPLQRGRRDVDSACSHQAYNLEDRTVPLVTSSDPNHQIFLQLLSYIFKIKVVLVPGWQFR